MVTTGDEDNESKLLMISPKNGLIQELAGGDQTWRMVEPVILDEHIYYASDSPDTKNYLYKFSVKEGTRETLAEIAGPVFYLRKVSRSLIFSSVAEPSRSTKVKNKAVIYKYNIDTGDLNGIQYERHIAFLPFSIWSNTSSYC